MKVQMKKTAALFLVLSALTSSGCQKSSNHADQGGNHKNAMTGLVLAGVAEFVRSSGCRIPASEEMVRLMKLPTDQDGKYYVWQFGVSPKDEDIRAIDVGEKNAEDVFLSRVNTARDAFERYSHLTSPRGELRSTVYTSYGSREQRLIGPSDPNYQKALTDFESQVEFWTSREQQIREKFPTGAPRQGFGEWLTLR